MKTVAVVSLMAILTVAVITPSIMQADAAKADPSNRLPPKSFGIKTKSADCSGVPCFNTEKQNPKQLLTNTKQLWQEAQIKKDIKKRAIDSIEKKRADEANKVMAKLNDYKKTLDNQTTRENTDKRIDKKLTSIHNKISGILSHYQSDTTPNTETNEPKIQIKQIDRRNNGSPFGGDLARVVYKVYSNESHMKNMPVIVQDNNTEFIKTIHSLSPQKSTTHTVYIKVNDLDSVNVQLGQN